MPKNFIVGDAGGTGTQWRVVKDGDIQQYQTNGFNAYTHDVDQLIEGAKQAFGSTIAHETPIYLYAAGVDTSEQQEEVSNALRSIFKGVVSVSNDLLGVARGLCGKEIGNVCILGTGSNACYYDGKDVNKVSASLGYILGDEGSGAYLGKNLLKKMFRNQFSKELIASFQEKFDLSAHEAIKRIYHQPRPNHYLASFATFVHDNRHHPQVHELIIHSFNAFFDAFFPDADSERDPYFFSGSIAYYFADYLRECGSNRGIHIKNIVQSPIAGLVLYHQQYD